MLVVFAVMPGFAAIASADTPPAYFAVNLFSLNPPGTGYPSASSQFQFWNQSVAAGQAFGNISYTAYPGETNQTSHAALWTAAGVQDLNPSGFAGSVGIATNGTQQVGWGYTGSISSSGQQAMLWTGTAASAMNLTPVSLGFSNSTAYATDGIHQVGGGYGPNIPDHALLWTGTPDSAVDLNPTNPALSAFTRSAAYGVWGGKQVGAGISETTEHAMLWSGNADSAVDLNPANYKDSYAMGIIGAQQVGSGHDLNGINHPLLWTGSADSAVDLLPTQLPGVSQGEAVATNGIQQVGYVTGSFGVHAFVWSGTAQSAVDLQALLPATQFTYSYATSIDLLGNIYGYAGAGPGSLEAVEWTPNPAALPEPATLALCAIGGLVLIQARRP